MPNGCNPTGEAGNWMVELIEPDVTVPNPPTSSNVFRYRMIRQDGSQEMSNIRVCFCPGQDNNANRIALFDSCSGTVFYDNGEDLPITCDIANTPPNNPNENPADCEGVKFEGILSGNEAFPGQDVEQTEIEISITLKQAVLISPIEIGLKAGNNSGVVEDICGASCESAPPTRGVLL